MCNERFFVDGRGRHRNAPSSSVTLYARARVVRRTALVAGGNNSDISTVSHTNGGAWRRFTPSRKGEELS
jgi:hypothetical protein